MILVLNSGSSSLKCGLFDLKNHQATAPIWESALQWKGHFDDAVLEIKTSKKKISPKITVHSSDQAIAQIVHSIVHGETAVLPSLEQIDAIGHRIVHGGRYYRESTLIDSDVKDKIRRLAEYAPLHNMAALQGIEGMQIIFKDKPQIAVFDTAFHHTLPLAAAVYPGPYRWMEEGIQRYGFHGISYQYCSQRALEMNPKASKMVICHLGAGASLCAVLDGKSVDTTMGFTPLEGLMMNTRCGTIDPGIVLEKMKKMSLDDLTNELYRESGLLGISGVSSDMRDILKQISENNERCRLAFEIYIHRLCALIGSMIASLQGIDTIVFTAGIGENTPILREKVCERLAFLGAAIDLKKNETQHPQDCDLSHTRSKIKILLIHTQEAFEIARECYRIKNLLSE